MGIRIVREHRDHSRFWELFRPTTNNFQFWLATSAFSFFVYQSLFKVDRKSNMIDFILHQAIPVIFAVAGGIGVLGLIYLFVTWIAHIGVKKTTTVVKSVRDLGLSLAEIETKVNELRIELNAIAKEAEEARKKMEAKHP